MDKLVSVVVTCYNHELYIEQCIRSLFSQTYSNIELFILNDGSTDRSGEIIESLIDDSPFHKTEYHFHENQGVVITRNKGLEMIDGDYLLFVDSDNYLPSEFISVLVEKAEQENADIVYTQLVDSEDGKVLISRSDFDLATLYKGNFMDNCSLIRRAIIGDTRYDKNLKKLVDYDFFMDLIVNKQAKAISCMETCIFYRVLENSISDHKNIIKYYDAYVYLLAKYMIQYPEYAREAFDFNIKRALAWENLTMQYVKESVTVYFSSNQEFSEERTYKFSLHTRDSLELKLPLDTKYVRIDISEQPSFYTFIRLLGEKGVELLPQFHNSIHIGDFYLFPNPDPQLVYELPQDYYGQTLTLSYQMCELNNLHSDDYLGKLLAQELLDSRYRLAAEVRASVGFLQEKLALAEQVKKQQADLEELTRLYNSVVFSRRWTIPTKIINFFRRKK